MENCALFICFLSLFFIHQTKGDLNRNELTCIIETQTTKEYIAAILSQRYMPEDNEEFKNYLGCSWLRSGYVNEDGTMIFSKFSNYLMETFNKTPGSTKMVSALAAVDTLNFCKMVRGDQPGTTAVRMTNCILRRIDSYSL